MTATIPVKEGVLKDLKTKLVDIAAKIKDQDEDLRVSDQGLLVSPYPPLTKCTESTQSALPGSGCGNRARYTIGEGDRQG